jgi:hypothetical protein
MRHALAMLLVAALLGGCSLGDEDSSPPPVAAPSGDDEAAQELASTSSATRNTVRVGGADAAADAAGVAGALFPATGSSDRPTAVVLVDGDDWQSAVAASVLAGALTHLVWDALTHTNDHTLQAPNWFQHANTALGSAILGWWIWRRVRRVPPLPFQVSAFHRGCAALAIGGVMAISALKAADGWPAFDRQLIKSVGIGALQGLAAALLVYSLAFRRKILGRAAWRA